MSDIQGNLDLLLSLLDRANSLESSIFIDVGNIIQNMNNELGLIKNEYDGVLLGGLINPLFCMLEKLVIMCLYAQEYIHIVCENGLVIDENHLIIANQMIKQVEIITDEIRMLKVKLCNH